MRIVADENIVAVDEYFSQFGELVKLPGRKIKPEDVRHADALLVRSITRVDRQLLEGSRVRFVATATSGTDHLDLDWLQQTGITVADAAGSNANAVVEYVLAAICELMLSRGFTLQGKSFAIIGAGQVGGRLAALLGAMGVEPLICDPFLEQKSPLSNRFCSLTEALRADIVSLHTPFRLADPHRTYHMLDAGRLAALSAGTLLINTSRGEVIDNSALLSRLQSGPPLLTIMDVWENEPQVNPELVALAAIATPHIAGYSLEAKQSASERNYRSLLAFFNARLGESAALRQPTTAAPTQTPYALEPELSLRCLRQGPAVPGNDTFTMASQIRDAFPVRVIDRNFRIGLADIGTDGSGSAELFDRLRGSVASRREFGLAGWVRQTTSAENGSACP